MRDPKQLQNLYHYKIDAPVGHGRGIKPDSPEEEAERYYSLVHIKLAPRRLRLLSVVNVFVLLGIVFVLFLAALLLPKPTESIVEKRPLSPPPSFSIQALFSGQLAKDTQAYFSDTFPMREWFVTFSAVVNENRGVRINNIRVIMPRNNSNEIQELPNSVETTSPAPSAQTPPLPEGTPTPETDRASAGDTSSQEQSESAKENTESQAPANESSGGLIDNGICIYDGRAMSLYGGSHESARRYASVLNSYQEELKDVQVYNLIVPTSAEFYMPQEYASMTRSQKEVIDYIYGLLGDGIKKVDAYSAIKAHTDEYLYFRTDHHWTGRAAYYAYTAFCEKAGIIPLSMDDFETRTLKDFIGTMYAQNQDSTLLKNPDYVDYYLFNREYTASRYDKNAPYTPIDHKLWGEYAKSPNSYSVFLQGDFPLISVKTDVHNGRKIMVVKESFGNAFAPFLINHYEEVYIADLRYFQLPMIDFIQENGIQELLFINNSFAVCTPYHITCLDNLRHQVYYAPAVETIADTGTAASSEGADSSEDEAVEAMAKSGDTADTAQSSPSEETGGLLKKREAGS